MKYQDKFLIAAMAVVVSFGAANAQTSGVWRNKLGNNGRRDFSRRISGLPGAWLGAYWAVNAEPFELGAYTATARILHPGHDHDDALRQKWHRHSRIERARSRGLGQRPST
jgi:hypothetical protein